MVRFTELSSSENLAKFGLNFQVGQSASARFLGNDTFSFLEKPCQMETSKGNLITVRYVKYIPGKGFSVQLPGKSDQYGFLPICEVTDDLDANVAKYVSDRRIFAARVISLEPKTGKPILSCRQSVIDSWPIIHGTSLKFKDFDQKR
jgi:hypothetical protein